MPGNTHWTKFEKQALRDLFPIYGDNLPELERTPNANRQKAAELGIKRMPRPFVCANPKCETPWMELGGLELCVCCYNTQYYQKNKSKLQAYARQAYWENREARLEYNREYRELARSLR